VRGSVSLPIVHLIHTHTYIHTHTQLDTHIRIHTHTYLGAHGDDGVVVLVGFLDDHFAGADDGEEGAVAVVDEEVHRGNVALVFQFKIYVCGCV